MPTESFRSAFISLLQDYFYQKVLGGWPNGERLYIMLGIRTGLSEMTAQIASWVSTMDALVAQVGAADMDELLSAYDPYSSDEDLLVLLSSYFTMADSDEEAAMLTACRGAYNQ